MPDLEPLHGGVGGAYSESETIFMASVSDLLYKRRIEITRQYQLAHHTFHQLRVESQAVMARTKELQAELNGVGPRKRKIPEDFKVTPAMIEWAAANKLPDPRTQLEQFMDYHRAKGDTMLDWAAAFRTWMRNCKKWAKDVPVLQLPKKDGRRPTVDDREKRHDPKVAAMLSDLVRQFDVRTK